MPIMGHGVLTRGWSLVSLNNDQVEEAHMEMRTTSEHRLIQSIHMACVDPFTIGYLTTPYDAMRRLTLPLSYLRFKY